MRPDDDSAARLDDLRRRWEADPGSRIYLQLAEEYRRAGRPGEALEVLEKGLESHPNQVSALVALGRTLVDLGRPGRAVQALDKAMAIDGTNPMAQKVAAIANLELGDRDQARRHLDLYKLINSGDDEIAELEARLDAPAASPPPLPGAEPPAAAEAETDNGTAAAETGREPTGWSPTAAWPALPQTETDMEAILIEEHEAPSAAPGSEAEADGDDEPFAHLYANDQRERYLHAFAAEGIFPLDEAAPAADSSEQPAEEPAAADGEERPTVTLGRLYLEQGHHAEAERIFAAVLARDPDNDAARLGIAQARAGTALESPEEAADEDADAADAGDDAGEESWVLEEVGEPRRYTLTARRLLAGTDPEAPPKLALVRAYLDRLVARRAEGEQGTDVS